MLLCSISVGRAGYRQVRSAAQMPLLRRERFKMPLQSLIIQTIQLSFNYQPISGVIMADVKRTRRNTIERRCLGKAYKRLFVGSNKTVFKVLEKIKKN